MVINHLLGILVAVLKKGTNAVSESKNNKIKHIKKRGKRPSNSVLDKGYYPLVIPPPYIMHT